MEPFYEGGFFRFVFIFDFKSQEFFLYSFQSFTTEEEDKEGRSRKEYGKVKNGTSLKRKEYMTEVKITGVRDRQMNLCKSFLFNCTDTGF